MVVSSRFNMKYLEKTFVSINAQSQAHILRVLIQHMETSNCIHVFLCASTFRVHSHAITSTFHQENAYILTQHTLKKNNHTQIHKRVKIIYTLRKYYLLLSVANKLCKL